MLTFQRRQLYPAVVLMAATALAVILVLAYRATRTTTTAHAPTAEPNGPSSPSLPASPNKPRSALRLTATSPTATKLAVPLDAPYLHGNFTVSFSKPERRPNEREKPWGFRVQFLDQYERFVHEGKIGPAQENAIRAIYADAQIALQKSYAVSYPEDLDSSKITKLKIEAETNIEQTMRKRLNDVLNSEQRKLLVGPSFVLLRFVNSLGFEPFEVHRL